MPRSSFSTVSLLLALFAASAQILPPAHALKIEFVGKAPKFKVFSGVKPDDFFKITFGAIKELDASGNAVTGRSISSLASQKLTEWTEKDVTLGNATAKEVRMRFDLSTSKHLQKPCGGGKPCGTSCAHFDKAKHQIDVVVYLVENNTAVPYGNSTITVKSNSVKFNVESENWPFCDAANSLSVTTDIETVEKVASNDAVVNTTDRTNTTGSSSGEPEGTEVTLPSGTSAVEFDLPTIALVDDVETNVTVTVDASSSGTSTRFDFVFPNFKSLYYDPTVGFEDESGVESSSSSTGGSSTGGSSINYDGVDDETASTTTASPGIRATPALAPIALVAALNAMLAFLVD